MITPGAMRCQPTDAEIEDALNAVRERYRRARPAYFDDIAQGALEEALKDYDRDRGSLVAWVLCKARGGAQKRVNQRAGRTMRGSQAGESTWTAKPRQTPVPPLEDIGHADPDDRGAPRLVGVIGTHDTEDREDGWGTFRRDDPEWAEAFEVAKVSRRLYPGAGPRYGGPFLQAVRAYVQDLRARRAWSSPRSRAERRLLGPVWSDGRRLRRLRREATEQQEQRYQNSVAVARKHGYDTLEFLERLRASHFPPEGPPSNGLLDAVVAEGTALGMGASEIVEAIFREANPRGIARLTPTERDTLADDVGKELLVQWGPEEDIDAQVSIIKASWQETTATGWDGDAKFWDKRRYAFELRHLARLTGTTPGKAMGRLEGRIEARLKK